MGTGRPGLHSPARLRDDRLAGDLPGRSGTGDAMTLFEWLAAVCNELGWPIMRAHEMLDETRWSDMYEAGVSPAEAAARARAEAV